MKLATEDGKPTYVEKTELAFADLMRFVYKQRGISPDLMRKAEVLAFSETTAAVLNKAVETGIRQEKPSDMMVQRLQESNYVFSGFKTFHQMKEAFPSLLDEDGERKPFKQFLKEVQTVNEKYNKLYLQAEYNFAVTSSEMAAKWEKYEQDGDRYDLQYRTVGDDKVRESHRKLDGVTLPPSSPFWDEYFPPNGWRCRCTTVQVRKGKYARSDEHRAMEDGNQATGGKHAEMMRFNAGKRAACFPAYNPYTISKCTTCPNGNIKLAADVPNNELCAACRIIKEMQAAKVKETARKQLTKWHKENLPTVKEGKFQAKRFEVDNDALEGKVIINRKFYEEVSSKYKDDPAYTSRLEWAKKAHELFPKATLVREEPAKHHPDGIFKVFIYEENGVKMEFKCKVNNDGNYLYYMRLLP